MNRKVKIGEKNALPVKRRGRPLLLSESLDNEVKSYVGRVRKGGGVITTSIISLLLQPLLDVTIKLS